MNLDDLMEVWRSQDAAPLHGVNEVLLRLALRQDHAKLQAQRRREKRIIYLMSAILIAVMAIFSVMMFYNDDDVRIGLDFAITIVGVAAALVMSVALFVTRRAQAAREQGFGESLQDQLRRRIAQLGDQATKERRLARVIVVAGSICAMAIAVAGRRVNDVAFSEDWPILPGLILVCAFLLISRGARRSVQQDILPRKRRLEALLKELDA